MTLKQALVFAIAVLLASCSKSGGKKIVDNGKPPTIVSFSPADGADGVPLDASVGIVFSEAMDAATITAPGAFTLSRSSEIGAEVSVDGATATLRPDALLEPAATYSASISSLATDLFGDFLGATQSWSFTTVADTAPPLTGTITVGAVTTSSVAVSWPAAVDDAYPASGLSYAVYTSLADNIASLADIDANGTLFGASAFNLSDTVITGLASDTRYAVNVIVTDGTGKRAGYTMATARTASLCDGFSCGTGEHCALQSNAPVCVCDAGYHGTPCVQHTGWFGLEGSELGPWESLVIDDAALGSAISGGVDHVDVATSAAGDIWVAWPGGLRHWDGNSWSLMTVQGAVTLIGAVAVFPGADKPLRVVWDGTAWVGAGAAPFAAALGPTGDVFQTTTVASSNVTVSKTSSGTTTSLGNAFISTGGAIDWVAMAIDSTNNPVVVFDKTLSLSNVIQARRYTGSAWANYGSVSEVTTTGYSYEPDVVLQADDTPIVSFQRYSGPAVHVVRWSGSAWVTFGTTGIPGAGWHSKLVIDGSGALWLAYSDAGYPVQSDHLYRLNGSNWEAQPTLRYKVDKRPGLAVDAAGNVVVAYMSGEVSGNAVFMEIAGSPSNSFHPRGVSPSGEALSPGGVAPRRPRLAVRDSDAYVVYTEPNATVRGQQLVAQHWTDLTTLVPETSGTALADLALGASGGPTVLWASPTNLHTSTWQADAWSTLDRSASAPSRLAVDVDASGQPVIAWGEGSGTVNLLVERWNGAAWEALGPSSTVGSFSGALGGLDLDVTADGKVALGSLEQGTARVRTFDGVAWTTLTNPNASSSIYVAVAATTTGAPVVAMVLSDYTIGVRQWGGAAWTDFGGVLRSIGAGEVATVNNGERNVSLTLDAADHPFVAWQEQTYDGVEIYLKGWTGSAWAPVAGSAAGGGVSNSFMPSTAPSVAITDDWACVTWLEATSIVASDPEVLARCAWR